MRTRLWISSNHDSILKHLKTKLYRFCCIQGHVTRRTRPRPPAASSKYEQRNDQDEGQVNLLQVNLLLVNLLLVNLLLSINKSLSVRVSKRGDLGKIK